MRLASICLATLVACASGHAPELSGLSDQVAQVGVELDVQLDGTDQDGGQLTYSYSAADVTDLGANAEMTVAPSGAGLFRWTPLAADLGSHAFDFMVSDGIHTTTVTINIVVKSSIGSGTAPVFEQPLGTGTTIDLSMKQCVKLAIVVQDSDSPNVMIAQEEPVIDGALITPTDGQSAAWKWCPSADQIAADDRYTLILSANDGDNPKVLKDYLIVLRNGSGNTCPGNAPTIDHTPMDETTYLDLAINATIGDDIGLKDAPLIYYSTTDPGSTPDLSSMIQLSMTEQSGDLMSGDWLGTIPNPVATSQAGTQATVYYVMVAQDADSPTCSHVTQSQVYSMIVTAGGSDTAGLCTSCSADSQCGTGNECAYIGDMGNSYCLESCDSGCPSGYTCSSDLIYSVDFNSALQCVPISGSCEAPTQPCVDDSWEPDDTRSEASANPTLDPDDYSLVSCPSATDMTRANDDWYKIVVSGDTDVDLFLDGEPVTDLDLHLYHSDGTVIATSTSSTSIEEIDTCLTSGTYYVKVNGYGYARNEYDLSYTTTATSCQ